MARNEQHHITPIKTFLMVYASLIALTIITVLTALNLDIGVLNTPLAMLIATIKVLIVMAWFMHLKYDNRLNRLTIASAFFFLLLFYGITAADVFTRGNMENISMEELKQMGVIKTLDKGTEVPETQSNGQ